MVRSSSDSVPNGYEILAEQIVHERELRELTEVRVEKARQIQFDEYERRLNLLNHAHDQAIEAQARTVPREVFDNYVNESRARDSALAKSMTDKFEASYNALTIRFESEIKRLDFSGGSEFRETEAERRGREEATRDLLTSSRVATESLSANRRWLIGLSISTGLGLTATAITILFHILGQ